MKRFSRYLGGLIFAALTTSIIGSIFSTQFVIASLQDIDVNIPLATRLSMTIDDLAILQSLGLLTAACFVVAFIIAALCQRFIGGNRTLWHIIAGATALMTALLIMKAVLLITPIAGTRSTLGFMSFGLAGAIGGWVFALITSANADNKREESKQ